MLKRSQYSVIVVALGFFTTCLLMVGTMLSFTSDYQDQVIAKVINTSNTMSDVEGVDLDKNS